MPDNLPMPWLDHAVCGVCGGTLLPLTYPPAAAGDIFGGVERPHSKCGRCGRRYRWVDPGGWTPAAP